MRNLTEEEIFEAARSASSLYKKAVTWDKPSAIRVIRTIDAWLHANLSTLKEKMRESSNFPIDGAEGSFIQAYFSINAHGITKKRTSPEYYSDLKKAEKEFARQTDRGLAIVAVALLDANLERALECFFIPNLKSVLRNELFEGPSAPFATFASKIKTLYSFGMIGNKSYSDLNGIRKIRNKFAHDLGITSFEDEGIAPICQNLKIANFVWMGQTPPTNPRERFIRSVMGCMHFIYSEIVAGSSVGEAPTNSP